MKNMKVWGKVVYWKFRLQNHFKQNKIIQIIHRLYIINILYFSHKNRENEEV